MFENDLKAPSVPIEEIEGLATELGLQVLRSSLATYPGSTHWHFTKPGAKGTLECTWWPAKNRFWLSVHANRAAPWQASAIEAFELRFGKNAG